MWLLRLLKGMIKGIKGNKRGKDFSANRYYTDYRRKLCANTQLNPYSVHKDETK